jgi:hypothetical protein
VRGSQTHAVLHAGKLGVRCVSSVKEKVLTVRAHESVTGCTGSEMAGARVPQRSGISTRERAPARARVGRRGIKEDGLCGYKGRVGRAERNPAQRTISLFFFFFFCFPFES